MQEHHPAGPPEPEAAQTARDVLREMQGRLNDEQLNEWLLRLHEHFTDRMIADNSRIWQIGAIFVPLSLAAFAALTTVKGSVAMWQVLVLGLPSSGLVWLWLVIAENQRAFQQKSEAWLFAIEESRGFCARPAPDKYPKRGYDRSVTFPGAIQGARWVLACAVTIMWLVLALLAGAGKLAGGA